MKKKDEPAPNRKDVKLFSTTNENSMICNDQESFKIDLDNNNNNDDEDEEDENYFDDEQHKIPLIKNSKLVWKDDSMVARFGSTSKCSNLASGVSSSMGNNGNIKKKSVKFDQTKLIEESIDEDEELLSEHNHKNYNENHHEKSSSISTSSKSAESKSKHSLNMPPPITIGKIKIFKPSRRHRAIWIRRFFKQLVSLILCFLLLFFLFYNVQFLPELVRTAFGLEPFSKLLARTTSLKDKTSSCDRVVSVPVWRQNFPMLTIESALRLIDVNNDTIMDIIVPFGTGIDLAYYDQTLCQIYFNQTEEESKSIGCGGGVVAIDGKNGEPLWAQYTPHELFAINCNVDLNKDGHNDCIVGGRMASLYAFDSQNGKILWNIQSSGSGEPIAETSNFYTPLVIPKDVDNDNVLEIVVMHGGDPLRKQNDRIRNVARLMVVSGKTGQIIKWSYVPGNAESYYSPQLLVHPDGTLLIMYGTGGETHPGGLYVVGLEALLSGQLEHNSRRIFEDCCKGVISPPALVDINSDNILDIILANFNSTVFAFDGLTFEQIWKYQFIGAETYSTPSVGFFNNDDVPDFGVIYQFGPGFPIYYSTEFQVLDGRNGVPLLKKPIRMPIGTQSSPLTVSTMAQNDIFLFWYSSCYNSSKFITNINGSNFEIDQSDIASNQNYSSFKLKTSSSVHESSRSDFCHLRYQKDFAIKQFTQYQAITWPNTRSIVYDSRTDEPIVEPFNFTEISYQWYQQQLSQMQSTLVNNNNDNSNSGDSSQPQWDSLNDPSSSISINGGADGGNVFKDFDNNFVYKKNPSEDFLKNFKSLSVEKKNDIPDYPADVFGSERKRRNDDYKRFRRHVGLHNGDNVQRVISTGTLAPSLKLDRNLIDDSIDLIFATYSFPPTNKAGSSMPEAMKKCLQAYLSPEKETEMRLMNENSPFKQEGYDHDAYESAVKDLCLKQTSGELDASKMTTRSNDDPVKANDWIKEMGSMTIHRINLKCFDTIKSKQIQIKEYRYQRWPSYLGILGDSVVNVIDD